MPPSASTRLQRSLKERIYLLAAFQEFVDMWNFTVRGQSSRIYNQQITTNECKCSCPDNKSRNIFCKHLLFLISRVGLQLEIANDVSKYNGSSDLSDVWDRAKYDKCTQAWVSRLLSRDGVINNTFGQSLSMTVSAVGSDCSICFEAMTETDSLAQCKTTCKNYFHDGCINLWLASKHSTCPLCRADWSNPLDDADISADSSNIMDNVQVRLLPQIRTPNLNLTYYDSSPDTTPDSTQTPDTTPAPATSSVPEPDPTPATSSTPEPDPAPTQSSAKRGRKPKVCSTPANVPANSPGISTVSTPPPTNPADISQSPPQISADTPTSAPASDTAPASALDTTIANAVTTSAVTTNTGIDIVFSFDTTGSMHSCLREVRRNITVIIPKLFADIPNLRISIIAHGDYCDAPNTIKILDFTTNQAEIIDFINTAPATGGGGNGGECYELVLHEAQKLSWRLDTTMRSLILIGDEPPHEKNTNPYKLDWREEATEFAHRNIQIFSVQCLNIGRKREFEFYSTIARITNGYHLFLDQFSYVKDMIQAVCFKQFNMGHLSTFESELEARNGGINETMRLMFDTMLGRKTREQVEAEMRPDAYLSRYRGRNSSSSASASSSASTSASTSRRGRASSSTAAAAAAAAVVTGTEADLRPCIPSRFQVFNVSADIGIREFCDSMSISFVKGNGYYEFIKPEIVQPGKEIVLMDRVTGNLYEGDVARFIAGIGANNEKAKLKPASLAKYRVFVQSTSVTRKLVTGQGFLYEVDVN